MQNNFKVCKMVFMIFLFQHFKNKTQYFACLLPFSILYMVVSVYGCFAPRNQFDCVVNSVSLLSFHMFVHFEMQSELFFMSLCCLCLFRVVSYVVCFYSFFVHVPILLTYQY